MARPSAREKLLDTAERLFADHGVAAVSLRQVNAEAGLSPAALHYHFGTGQAVVEALLERRMPAMMEHRQQLLDALEAAPREPAARDVLAAIVEPVAQLLRTHGEVGRRYVRLLHRLQIDGDLDHQFVIRRFPGGVDRLMPLLDRALPDLPRPVRTMRFRLAIDTLLFSVAQGPESFGLSLDDLVIDLLDFATGALEAPVSPRHVHDARVALEGSS